MSGIVKGTQVGRIAQVRLWQGSRLRGGPITDSIALENPEASSKADLVVEAILSIMCTITIGLPSLVLASRPQLFGGSATQ